MTEIDWRLGCVVVLVLSGLAFRFLRPKDEERPTCNVDKAESILAKLEEQMATAKEVLSKFETLVARLERLK